MSRVRVFYGHEGVIPPHGPSARRRGAPATRAAVTSSADEAQPVTIPDGFPDDSWKVAQIDAFAEAHGVEVEGKKADKLAALDAALTDQSEDDGDDDDSVEVVYGDEDDGEV